MSAKCGGRIIACYPDQVDVPGHQLNCLTQGLLQSLGGSFEAIHLLPVHPYIGDEFCVSDFSSVRAEVGTWGDLEDVCRKVDVILDLVCSHVSVEHVWYRDFLSSNGGASRFFVLGWEAEDLRNAVKAREHSPLQFTGLAGADGTRLSTFDPSTVDLDYSNPRVLLEMLNVAERYANAGCVGLRLDAIGFLWKERGSPCIHLPEAGVLCEIISRWFRLHVRDGYTIAQADVFSPDSSKLYWRNGDGASLLVDYGLPAAIAAAVVLADVGPLCRHFSLAESIRLPFVAPTRTHDGIYLQSSGDGLQEGERDRLCDRVEQHAEGAVVSLRGKPYELALSLPGLCALDRAREERSGVLLNAHLVACMLPGMPYLYLPALLGHVPEALAAVDPDRPRDLNRTRLSEDEFHGLLRSRALQLRRWVLDAVWDLRVKAEESSGSVAAIELDQGVMEITRGDELLRVCVNFARDARTIAPERILPNIVLCNLAYPTGSMQPGGCIISTCLPWPVHTACSGDDNTVRMAAG